MTAATSADASAPSNRRSLAVTALVVVAVLVVAVVLLSLVAPAQRNDGPPLDPESTGARGTRAATESITSTSTAPERISTSAISSACSPLSGCETSRLSVSTPSLPA